MTTAKREITPAYLWFDAEFTDLDPDRARLLQVALLVTDANLKRLTPRERDLNLHVRLEPDVPVSVWVARNLADLISLCRSEKAVPIGEVDRRLAALVDEAVGPVSDNIKRRPVLAGNTVHMDVALARKFLPEFSRRLHYRLLDVSTIKILWNDWFPGPVFDKEKAGMIETNLPPGIELPASGAHDAYYDIHASLAELNYYRRQLGGPPEA
jgi:oligoribonuclease